MEKMIHTLISDVFHITNDSSKIQYTASPISTTPPKTFLYEFCSEGT